MKEYNQRPEVKARAKKRQQQPAYKASQRERRQRLDVKTRDAASSRRYKQKYKNGLFHVYTRTNPHSGMIYIGCSEAPELRWLYQDGELERGGNAPPL